MVSGEELCLTSPGRAPGRAEKDIWTWRNPGCPEPFRVGHRL